MSFLCCVEDRGGVLSEFPQTFVEKKSVSDLYLFEEVVFVTS